MGFDSVFNGDPTTPNVTASGNASFGIDLSSGKLYFRDNASAGWQPVTVGGDGSVLLAPTGDQTIMGDHQLDLTGTGRISLNPNIDAQGYPAITLGTGNPDLQSGEFTALVDQTGGGNQGLFISNGATPQPASVVIGLVGPSPVFSLTDESSNTFQGQPGAFAMSDVAGDSLTVGIIGGSPAIEMMTAAGGDVAFTFVGTTELGQLNLPNTKGQPGQVLTNDGAGGTQQMSWADATQGSPTSAGTAGRTGQILWDSGHIYVCTSGGIVGAATWKAAALSAV